MVDILDADSCNWPMNAPIPIPLANVDLHQSLELPSLHNMFARLKWILLG